MPNMAPALEQLTDRGPIEAHLADPQVLIFDPTHIVQRHAVRWDAKSQGVARDPRLVCSESKYSLVRLGWMRGRFRKTACPQFLR